jgi:hypothetical protein
MVNCYWFWSNYLITRPRQYVRDWQVGANEMVIKSSLLSSFYDHIWISRSGWGWIHILFHLQYDPSTFQKEAKVSARNDLGFWWVNDVGKFHLDWFPKNFSSYKNTLFVGMPYEFPSTIEPFDKVVDPYGNDVFWFVDGKQLLAN